MSSDNKKADAVFIALICLGYLIVALFTDSHYGITWDQAEHEWYYGERNLNYLLTFDKKWVDFSQRLDPAPWPDHPQLFTLSSPWQTLNFGNMISAFGCRVFYRALHLTGAIEAHHVPGFLLVAGAMAAMFFFMRRKYGLLAASVAMPSIAFQPHFWANTHFNTKDIPYTCLMTFTMLAARAALRRRSAGLLVLSSILLGFSGGIKPNAALIPAILIVWYIISHKELRAIAPADENGKNLLRRGKFLVTLSLAPLVALAAFIITWPYLWSNTLTRIVYFLEHYMAVANAGPDNVQWDTLYLFASAQPPAALIFGGIGLVTALISIVRGDKRDESSFLLLWFCAPVLRMILPKAHDYDSVRHFIEYAVPLGALMGIGVSEAFNWIKSAIAKWARRFDGSPTKREAMIRWGSLFSVMTLAIPFATWFVTMVRIHPYEVAYYNFLVGGTRGASARWADATDYWGSSYRDGIKWLNENAETGATVVAPVGGYVLASVRRMWLRKDIALVVMPYTEKISAEEFISAFPADERSKLYVIYITKRGWYNRFARDVDAQWREIFSIKVDGAPILKIMKAPPRMGE